MAVHPTTDFGNHGSPVYGGATNTTGAPLTITAAGTGDNTAVTGATVDRHTYDNPMSVLVQVLHLAALQATETLDLAVELQESSDGSTWDTAEALQASATVATGDTGGTNESGVTHFNVNLRNRKRYFRVNFTPDLSASGTDTAILMTALAFGGGQVVPAV